MFLAAFHAFCSLRRTYQLQAADSLGHGMVHVGPGDLKARASPRCWIPSGERLEEGDVSHGDSCEMGV